MKKLILIMFVIINILIITSCEDFALFGSACETFMKSDATYSCTNTSASLCTNEYSSWIEKFYSGKTCKEIGYTVKGDYGTYTSPSGEKYPGSGSTMDTGSSGSGGGSAGKCSDSYYTGPSTTSYPQSGPFCKMAWYYRCMGYSSNSTEVKTYCAYYKNFENVPVCPSCN